MGVFSKSQNEYDASGLNGGKSDAKPEAKATNGRTLPDMVSTLAQGVLLTGNIVSEGRLQICGRVNGDIHASQLVVNKGAQVEGNIIAQEATILGACKGIIHGNSVRLQDEATVEGEIYSKSLTIEQNAQFEGVSRRLDKPVDAPANVQVILPVKVTLAPEAAPAGAPAD